MQIIGAHITCFGNSLHKTQSGIIVADYESMVLVKADDPTYHGASKNSIGDGKYFQCDALLYKINKEPHEMDRQSN